MTEYKSIDHKEFEHLIKLVQAAEKEGWEVVNFQVIWDRFKISNRTYAIKHIAYLKRKEKEVLII